MFFSFYYYLGMGYPGASKLDNQLGYGECAITRTELSHLLLFFLSRNKYIIFWIASNDL